MESAMMTVVPTLDDFQSALSRVDRTLEQPGLGLEATRHAWETVQPVWLWVLAFCWLWEEHLAFGKCEGQSFGGPRTPASQ
jgi:hypothetical protein